MSLRKMLGMQGGVQDFRFQIIPKSITLPKHTKSFIVYLEKGMQVLGKFENDQNILIKQSYYRFRHDNPAVFLISTLLHCNYTWSLYSINLHTNEETFEDSTSFNLERTIKLYQMELLQKQREIQTSIKQKNFNKGIVLALWEKIKKEMKTYRSKQTCLFSNPNFQIEFQVEIKNILDFELEQANEQTQRNNALRRNRSHSSSIHSTPSPSSIKTKPTPQERKEVIELDTTPYLFSQQKIKQTADSKNKQTIDTTDSIKEAPEEQDFNATVKIMNPKGQQINTQNQAQDIQNEGEQSNTHNNNFNPFQPLKKFSLLSDIIQQSHEGSSSYGGHYDRSSSNDAKPYPAKYQYAVDMVIQKPQMPMGLSPFNKVRTLPYQSHHHTLEVKDRFRRAQTAQKKTSQQPSQIQQESIISNLEETPVVKQNKIDNIFIKKGVAIALIILFLIFVGLAGGKNKKKKNRI